MFILIDEIKKFQLKHSNIIFDPTKQDWNIHLYLEEKIICNIQAS